MKKVIAVILVVLCCFMFTGCANSEESYRRFLPVYTQYGGGFDTSYSIIFDVETKVMYLYSSYVNRAGLTVMLDADGKPLLYEGGTQL